MVRKFLQPSKLSLGADWGMLILRLGISALLMTHGFPKFQKIIAGDFGFADPIGLGTGVSLVATVGAEFFLPILVMIGLCTRLAVLPIIFTMIVVVFVVHGNDEFSKQEHGLLFLFSYLCILLAGPGKYSWDQKLFKPSRY
jgi:putative oxidoreductase